MKKAIAKTVIISALTIILSVALCGCGSAADAYREAVEKYNQAAGITATGTVTVSLDAQKVATISSTFMINNGENRQATLDINADIDTGTGSVLQTSSKAFYADGRYYTIFSDSKYYMTLDWESALNQMGVYGLALGFTDEDFEGIVVEESAEGDLISFVIPAESSEKLAGISTQLSRIIPDAKVNYDHVQGKIILDENGAPAAQNITVSAVLDNGEEQVSVTEEIYIKFELSEQPLAVEGPGLGYTSLD